MTGRYRSVDDLEDSDARRQMDRFQDGNLEENLLIADIFKRVALEKDCTPAQLILSWLMSQGSNIFVIPGTNKVKYLVENLAASEVIMTEDEERDIRKLLQETKIAGSRNNWWSSYVETDREQNAQ